MPHASNLAVVDDAHAVAQPLDELELVAREDDRDTRVRPLAEHARHHVDSDRVEPGEGLVEHQKVRPEDEGRGQLDPLLVAQAQRLQLGIAPVGEAEPVQPVQGGLPGFRVRHAVELAEVGELLRHVHLGIQATLLRHIADATPGLERQGYAQPAHHAGIRREHAQRNSHRCRLAGAVTPHEAEQLASVNVEGEVRDGDEVAVALRDANDFKDTSVAVHLATIAGCPRRSRSVRGHAWSTSW